MAVKAFFDFNSAGRTVTFQNLSEDFTSVSWDFGDGSPASADLNPIKVYADDGKYLVKLTATNAATNNIFAIWLIVTEAGGANLGIYDQVVLDLPTGYALNQLWVNQQIKKWQEILQPAVYKPYAVAPADTYLQDKWPGILNTLIAKLVIYDLASKQIREGLTSSASSSGKGGLKKIESGPSVAEWYDNTETMKTLSQPGGLFESESLTGEICLIAAAVGIALPMCPIFPNPFPFIVGKKEKLGPYATYIEQ